MSDIVERLLTAADRADTIFDASFASPWRDAAAEITALHTQVAALTKQRDAQKAFAAQCALTGAEAQAQVAALTTERDALALNVQSAMHELDGVILQRDDERKSANALIGLLADERERVATLTAKVKP